MTIQNQNSRHSKSNNEWPNVYIKQALGIQHAVTELTLICISHIVVKHKITVFHGVQTLGQFVYH